MDSSRLSRLLREARLRLGLTQTGLAVEAGVSLPAIQLLEAGRGNPSLSTLNALFGALGLELRVDPGRGVDWDALAACGAPLTASRAEVAAKPSPRLLARLLRDVAVDAEQGVGGGTASDGGRRRDAVSALLLALKTHYPAWYGRHCRSPALRRLTPARVEGRHLRLRRVALDRLAEYL